MSGGLSVIDGGGDGGPVVQRRPLDRSKRYCGHDHTELDTECRRTFCRGCGEEVDNFDALLRLAEDWEVQRHRTAEATRDADRLEAKVEELRREERNLRARVRRLKAAGASDA